MTLRSFLHAVAHLSVVAAVFAGSPAWAQTTITVETTDQQSAAQCTLSDAINAINTWQPFGHCPTGQGVDTIRVPAGLYELATNAVNEDGELTALPYVTRPVRIVGDGPGATVIRRLATAPAMRLFKFQAPFEISGMTLAGGAANHYRGGGAILAETFNVAGNALMTATVRNMVFDGNAAPQGGALADTGFWYGPFVEFTLDQVVFTGNSSTVGGGAIYLSPNSVINATASRFEDNTAAAWGGAIYNHSGGQVAITDSQFLRNIANQDGGAIHAASPVLTRVTFAGNQAAASGGALYSYGGRPAITASTFSGNRAQRGGAVEVNAGSVVIDASTFAANTAFTTEGGALSLDDRLRTSRITNSTFSANLSASYGAIALLNGAVTIVNSTIVFNTNTPGGWSAGVSAGFSGSNEVFLSNSIVAGNTSDGVAADLRVDAGSGGDRVVSLGHNLIGSNEYVTAVFSPATGDLFGTMAVPLAAGLLPLADNGGPTLTHALAAGSAAFDAGSLASPGTDEACLPVDQRGSPRPGVNTAACDIGAFESEVLIVPGGPTTTSVSASPNPSTVGEAVTFTAIVTAEPGAVGTPTGVVTFTETIANLVIGSSAIDAAGAATLTTSALPAGLLTIQAAYAGDGVFTGSSSTLGQTVVAPPAPTVTTLVSSANPAMSGAPVTLTATVTALAPGSVPAGSVAFVLALDNMLLGSATLDAAGVAALTVSTLPEGTLQIDATYVPAGLFLGSAASVTQAVSPLPDAAIRNGVPESREGFSGVGTLLSGAGRPSCTGTMVSQFVVLTAAQCVRNAALADVSFSLGDGRSAPAAAVMAHPQFETADGINMAFDVALVMLDRDAAGMWNDVTRASLAGTPPALGVQATAVGFGAERTSGQLLVNDYLSGEGPVGVPIADAFIEALPADAANQMFCEAGVGGPLFDQDRVAGIASFRFVETCAEPGPGYYLAISRLTDWVQATVEELEVVVTPPRFTLTVSWNAAGVIVDESGTPLCPATPGEAASCTVEYDEGTVVQLRPQPADDGAMFATWGGSCVLRFGCLLTMDGPKSVHAKFGYPVTVTRTGAVNSSTVLVNGEPPLRFDCTASGGAATCRSFVDKGPVALLAQAVGATQFTRWVPPSPCAAPTHPSCSFNLTGPTEVRASFAGAVAPLKARITNLYGRQPEMHPVPTGPMTPFVLSGATSSDPAGGGLTYRWTKDTQTGTNAVFYFTAGLGSHTVTLTVTDVDGRTDTATYGFLLLDRQGPVITVTNPSVEATSGLSAPFAAAGITAVDAVSGAVPVTCRPSGSFLPVTTLQVGRNDLTCTAQDTATPPNTTTQIVTVRVTAPLLRAQAQALQDATVATPGASAPMIQAAGWLVTLLDPTLSNSQRFLFNILSGGLCRTIDRYTDEVIRAAERRRRPIFLGSAPGQISPASAQALLAAADELRVALGCPGQ